MFRLHFYRSPKSLFFKDQPTKVKFFVLKSKIDWLEKRVTELEEGIK